MSVGVVNKQTGERIPTAGMPAIDSVLSGSSTNPVQNRVVKAALDEKADTDIVASDFDATASYTAGNYCIYEGKFYKFKNNHTGAWSAADVDEIKIAGELTSLKSGLTSFTLVDVPTLYATKCAGTVAVHFINTAFTPASDDLSTLIGSNNKPSEDVSTIVSEVSNGNALILTYKTNGMVELKSMLGVLIDHTASVYGSLVFNA